MGHQTLRYFVVKCRLAMWAKDVEMDIRPKKGQNKEQQDRYKDGLPNLIYTNGTDWDFYRHNAEGKSVRVASCKIADFVMGLQPDKTQFDVLQNLLLDFVSQETQTQTITSSNRLAKIMAGKAKIIRDAIGKALVADKDDKSELAAQYIGFRDTLLHDIKKVDFADIYAETIVYGMFAARYHDPTPENFSRQEALELLPKSNPFLRKLFTFIASHDLDEGIRWIIDDLANIFQATNVQNLMNRWSDANDKRDPFLHFYETFLAEYNPKKRKSRGVWYTPEAVVNFIVRAVDDVLKTEFNLPEGLADTSKVAVKVDTGETKEVGKKGNKKRVPVIKTEKLHRVQILDPATGTGTFLAEVIKQVTPRIKAVNAGGWSNYVERDLIPRLHGFELLMASYAMCHMKLDMMLSETGYKPSEDPPRLSVWLTNSLEEPKQDDNSLPLFGLARAISVEAHGANEVKRDKPIMCIIGNPPYSVSSQNKGDWISNLIKPYKIGLNERKINLDDDYIKFLRFSENLIEKNGEGVLAMITNNSFLKGVTHRKMRKHLLGTFDKIYVVDLHGDSNRLEKSPDGSKDQNVFDIMQGVSISVFIKRKNPSNTLQVLQKDLFGGRESKNKILFSSDVHDDTYTTLKPIDPYYFFADFDYANQAVYQTGFKITKLFENSNTGIQTKRDALCLHYNKKSAQSLLENANKLSRDDFVKAHSPGEDTGGWKLERFLEDAKSGTAKALQVLYRPFDIRALLYSKKSGGVLGRPRHSTMRHMILGENLSLLCGRQNKSGDNNDYLVSTLPSEMKCAERTIQSYHFPLYLYPDEDDLDQTRKVNMDADIRAAIEDAARDKKHGTPDEVAIFDYIYGVLHCPIYRETYVEFLKIDFPRVPYPPSPDVFWDVSDKGRALRLLHLMDGVSAGTAYPFKGEPVPGEENLVETINAKSYKMMDNDIGNVHINPQQYFAGVPKTAWEFYIGGYQPAQKWLKDRKGRPLSHDDIMHYRKIIHILMETDRIMKTIDMDLEGRSNT